MANDNRQEIQGSIVACESLDVREDLNVGGSLTVGGLPSLGGGGTPNTVARFVAPDSVGDGSMTDDGANVTVPPGVNLIISSGLDQGLIVLGPSVAQLNGQVQLNNKVNWAAGAAGGITNGVITPVALGAFTTSNYAPPGLGGANTVRQACSLGSILGGIDASVYGVAAVADGQMLLIVNLSAFALTLANEDAGSVAANRILTPGAAAFAIAAQGSVFLRYDGTAPTPRWRVIANAA
jgi:hypothetical protein